MPNRGKFIGSQDNLFVPDAPTIGTATAGNTEVSVAFTAPSDVGADAITLYGVSAFLAGATINYKVSVGTGTLSTGGSGNVYFIDGIPTKTLSLIKGFTYVFDLSDSSNSGHPFGFKNASDGAYTTGVTTSGTAGSASATVTLVLATDASEPSRYYCTSHGNGMGNTISLIEASASTDPLGAAQAGATGSSSPITLTGLSNGTSYIAQVWAINDYGNGPLSAATASFSPRAGRGLFAGGSIAPRTNVIDYLSIESTGNASDFGDLTNNRQMNQSLMSSTTRSVFTAGISDDATYEDTMDYVTIASTGNALDFGNLTVARFNLGACSSDTRGINFNGSVSSGTANTIDYITIASTGDATDFGDMNNTIVRGGGSSSPTRGIKYGGASYKDEIGYITIASTGDAQDFGNLTEGRSDAAAVSSSTRICMAGGTYTSIVNTIDYITTASTGNATNFGDLNNSVYGCSGTSNSVTGLIGGGLNGPLNVIDFITINTTGNATDFGDLTVARRAMSTGSNAHGGLA
jgi:hypothetical protein